MDLRGKKVVVVGLGKSGVAAARLLLARGARVIGNDQRGEAELAAEALALRAQGAQLALGGHDPALFASVDRIVLSPGVPRLPALAAAERARHADRERDRAGVAVPRRHADRHHRHQRQEHRDRRWSARCAGAAGGRRSSAATSGTPLVDAVDSAAGRAVRRGRAVELPARARRRLRVHVAALLNVTDDHLDRYASFAAYAAAKGNVFHNQTRRRRRGRAERRRAVRAPGARAARAACYRFGGATATCA